MRPTPDEIPSAPAEGLKLAGTDLSDYVTGQCLSICGGLHLGPA